MKKFISILMVLAVILSLGVTVMAEAPTVGSITVANATYGHVYRVYKIFDASVLLDADDNLDSIAYSIDPENNPFFKDLFGTDGKKANDFFTYDEDTDVVKLKDNVKDDLLFDYLESLIAGKTAAQTVIAVEEGKQASDYKTDAELTALGAYTTQEGETIVFSNMPCGYYLVTSTLGVAVTINSNAPDVVVNDKNQQPLQGGVVKEIYDADKDEWATENYAFIGDVVRYRVTYNATNYAGTEQILYYTMHDEKGSALWVEFFKEDSPYNIVVKVGDKELKRGYYHAVVTDETNAEFATNEWEYLGDWTGTEKNKDNADWYLIHYGYDVFEIVIPWLSNHEFKGQRNNFAFDFGTGAKTKYDSATQVTIEYYASVEPTADIGKVDNLKSEVYVRWTTAHRIGTGVAPEVYTHVDGLGILKMDSADNKALAGAEFEIFYEKADGTRAPLYVIPTNIAGVYVFDDYKTEGQKISGVNKDTAREKYSALVDAYLDGAEQKNVVVTPINGKIVVTGLKKGTYFIVEKTPPVGYNPLPTEQEIKVGDSNGRFYVYANENGAVADIQQPMGNFMEKEFSVVSADIYNSQGNLLPSTGGEGTFWLVTTGTLLAIGFAVFLITHKKMSIYTD